MMNKVKIVFWWNIPCVGMIGVLQAYSEKIDSSTLVVTGTLSQSRKSMGWDDQGKLFQNHIVLKNNEWLEKGREILSRYSDRLHVFNGITHPARMLSLIRFAIDHNIDFCNMSEAYSNLKFGLGSVLKDLYLNLYLPTIIRPIAKRSKGIICLSGSAPANLRQFVNYGFDSKSIYPFGYYTDEDVDYKYKAAADGKVHILCPGLLEKYKGVDVLIKAIYLLKQKSINNFVCHITGKGSQEIPLKRMSEKLDVLDCVSFEGVLNSTQYKSLLSHIDILVAPGRVEPWGIRINEAIQRGNAVVVSDRIGASELIEESRGGSIFKSGNAEDLARSLCGYLCDKNKLSEAKANNLKFKHTISCEYQANILSKIINNIQTTL